ncbi:MAG: hypothetical protein SFV21_07785 [Rhodospirillaceae bacterium]|nr:hypothetical protein [Rhodospirillaceae bacterium]
MKKFVIIAHARSGSFMLATGLAGQRHLEMHMELFNPHPVNRRTLFAVRRPELAADRTASRDAYYRDGESAAEFLSTYVYHDRYGPDVQAVGFKILYDQARIGPAASAWQRLADDTEIVVIHLTRRNLLATLVSLLVAQATRRWSVAANDRGPRPAVPPFTISPSACADFFRSMQSDSARIRSMFARHAVLELEYECDLVADFAGAARRVLAALSVPESGPLIPQTGRQARYRLSEQVSNFVELKAHFAGTQAATYFDESTAVS